MSSPSFHPEGKYISVVKDRKDGSVSTLKNGVVEQDIVDPTDDVTGSILFLRTTRSRRGISADQSYETNGLIGMQTD